MVEGLRRWAIWRARRGLAIGRRNATGALFRSHRSLPWRELSASARVCASNIADLLQRGSPLLSRGCWCAAVFAVHADVEQRTPRSRTSSRGRRSGCGSSSRASRPNRRRTSCSSAMSATSISESRCSSKMSVRQLGVLRSDGAADGAGGAGGGQGAPRGRGRERGRAARRSQDAGLLESLLHATIRATASGDTLSADQPDGDRRAAADDHVRRAERLAD